ncbi:MAG: hypothetical protein LBG45_08515 [Dysgonamonadaceae bacterium]|jgi:hypothetical protein|nr:hypothetical protein [Dysgonamonadaceae bacterium]
MNLIHYIQGIRKGSEINRLEREAMEDLVLAEAMEGYDKIRKGEHETRIKRMQNKVSTQTRPSNSTLHHWGVVASILLIIGIAAGGYFLWDQFNEPETVMMTENISNSWDTMAAEKSEEIADSFAEQEIQEDYTAKIDSKQPETITVNNEEETSIPVEKQLPVSDTNTDMIQPATVDSIENKSVISENAEQKKPAVTPEPVMGTKAYNEYLKKNLIRPTDDECKTATGFVTLSFLIDKNGSPYNVRVTKSLCHLADWEALRLVKEGPLWTTGESVATVNVHF